MNVVKRNLEHSMFNSRKLFAAIFGAFLFLLMEHSVAFAQEQQVDPTQPSERLLELINGPGQIPVAAVEASKPSGGLAAQHLRIRAMLLRDAEHGVALIGPAGSTGELLRVQLDPETVAKKSPVGQLLGQLVALESYSDHHVQLRSISTGESILIQ